MGADAEDEMISLVLKQVDGRDVTELLASGREKLASVPCFGGSGAAAPAAPAAGGAAVPAETKKEEKVMEKEESDEVSFFNWI